MDYEFAGLFSSEDPHNPVCSRSQSGYVVTFVNCTIRWVSNLHIDISLSTLHVDYVALSQSIRDLLPFNALAKETLKGIGLNTKKIKLVTPSSAF